MATLIPLPAPTNPIGTPSDMVSIGQPIPPIDRIKIFSDRQWEEFVLEWADSLREEYSTVNRCGGAGDMGRDIVAEHKGGGGSWDNFQCKHYRDALTPTDIWTELGKLVHYTYIKEYSYPKRYYFVAPQGAGNKLSKLFKNADELKKGLAEAWNDKCRFKITSTSEIEFNESLERYLEGLDFSIFEALPPLRVIDGHAKTRWHVSRFGGGLPVRPPLSPPPVDPTSVEAVYVRQLLDAYGDHLKILIATVSELSAHVKLREHFSDARIEFYSAESLRIFSRDNLPPGEFEKLQDEMHSGIRDEIRAVHPDGYQKLLSVVKTARALHLAGHALYSRISVRDHGGICHQLANDGKIKWMT